MDNSKLPGFTKKSSETPWSPTNERSRLSDRAGTVGSSAKEAIKQWPKTRGDKVRSWVKDEKDKIHERNIIEGKINSGKDKGKPTTGIIFPRGKRKNEEREY
jgi:hypothetical protein